VVESAVELEKQSLVGKQSSARKEVVSRWSFAVLLRQKQRLDNKGDVIPNRRKAPVRNLLLGAAGYAAARPLPTTND
jgi:hypothetical protein